MRPSTWCRVALTFLSSLQLHEQRTTAMSLERNWIGLGVGAAGMVCLLLAARHSLTKCLDDWPYPLVQHHNYASYQVRQLALLRAILN